jgi:hypothetical protein
MHGNSRLGDGPHTGFVGAPQPLAHSDAAERAAWS